MVNKSRKILSIKLVKSVKLIMSAISFVLVCFMLLPVLSSCKETANGNNNGGNTEVSQTAKDYTSKEVADAVMAVFQPEELPASGLSYFFSGADENSDNYVDPEKIGLLMTEKPSIVPEFDYLEDFALYVPSGQSIFEVSVLRVKKGEEAKIDAVKAVLEKRMSRVDRGELMNYAADEIPIFETMKVITVNNYVILLSTTDNVKAEKVINDMLGGNNSSLSNTPANTGAGKPTETTDANAGAEKKTVSMDEVVNIEPETDIDFNLFNAVSASTSGSASGSAVTPQPIVKVHMYSQNTMCFIGGTCEIGAKIKVTGGTEDFLIDSDSGNFFVEVPFAATGASVLKLSAVIDGKQPSPETAFIVKPQTDITLFEDGGAYGNVVGYNTFYFCEDSLASFEGDDVLKPNEITALQTRTEKKIKDLRDKGCNAEIIYLLVPNPMRVYAENAPKRYTENTGDTLRTQWEGAVKAAGATVIDLTDLFMEHKHDEFKIFQRTDTHWTEYGALLGYNTLMSYIGQKFPDAAPRPSSDFEISNKEFYWGDMYSRFYMEPSDLKEVTATVKFNFTPPGGRVDLYENGNCLNLMHAKVSMAQTTHTNLTGNFPSVYIYRDSFAGPLHAFITDRFSTATFVSMWNYDWKLNDIVSKNPDYVLYIINERNIVNVMYN